MELLRTAANEEEQQRLKTELYQPPKPLKVSGRRPVRSPVNSTAAPGRSAAGLTRQQAMQLMAQVAAEDAKLRS